jgi:hypothetical protein
MGKMEAILLWIPMMKMLYQNYDDFDAIELYGIST